MENINYKLENVYWEEEGKKEILSLEHTHIHTHIHTHVSPDVLQQPHTFDIYSSTNTTNAHTDTYTDTHTDTHTQNDSNKERKLTSLQVIKKPKHTHTHTHTHTP
eukprot:GHVR01006507.1.p1 GENE.GHVR01006507.1~~GHVR01006507.1.p1  ORF type:complete len:105 (+),score=79.91 GHVR01006507.1:181-495(+)